MKRMTASAVMCVVVVLLGSSAYAVGDGPLDAKGTVAYVSEVPARKCDLSCERRRKSATPTNPTEDSLRGSVGYRTVAVREPDGVDRWVP